ncbi:MAG: ABC-F family ATP-binding cassette domain-containing protein [Bacteroidales bacterium]|nr:ABC-F family ATP-binding cassette domain-containing protein [Bacteroidales bacterium]
MISLDDITVSYGGFTLLDGVSLHIGDRDRIGLVGKNGAGKSTMLKLIMDLQSPTSGKITRTSGQRIGYLPQIMEHHRGRTVIEEVMTVFDDIDRMEMRIDGISRELGERTDYESSAYQRLMVELSEVNDALVFARAEQTEGAVERTLKGLGFKVEEFDRLTETFSQGWNMRIELAKILLRRPDVLLLDEPTNHLDIESIQWLEDYLKGSFTGALVLISHDRRFLDNCTTRTVEVMLGHIYDYKVPYTQYVELRKERIAQQKAAYANQQRMIEKTEEFIERFRYKPTKSNQVQSRVKQLERIERIEIDDEDLSAITVKFPPAPRSGDVAFEVKDAVIGYPQKTVLKGASLIVKRGEKVAFVGRNGEGKTTMMRVLMGELEPFSGEAKVGYNVDIGYYAQNQEDVLDKKATVYDTLDRVAVGDIRMKLRDILAAFLFKGEDIDKKVAVLSGGERSRLAMAKLMLKAHNLLALDEPTNHMDIRSKDILKQALQAYDGTIIVVSHDRDFLNGLVDKVYEFIDGRVKEHLGGVDDFLRRKKAESFRDIEAVSAPKADTPAVQRTSESSQAQRGRSGMQPSGSSPVRPGQERQSGTQAQPRQDYNRQKQQSREEKRAKNRQNQLEKQIAELEAKMAGIEKVLAAPTPADDIMELTRNYLELKRDLDAKMDEWASL